MNRFDRVDGELQARISALAGAVRDLYIMQIPALDTGQKTIGPPPERRPPDRRDKDDEHRDRPPQRRPPPDDFGFDGAPPDRGPPPGGRGFEEFGKRSPPHDGRPFEEKGHRGPPPDRPKDFDKQVKSAEEPKKPTSVELPSEAAALFGDRPADYYYVVWYRDGSVLKRSANAPSDLTRPGIAERDTLPHLRTRAGFREAVHCSGLGDCVLAGRSVAGDLEASRDFAWELLAAGAVVLAIGLGLGFWFTGRAIRPIETISAAASRISHGNLSERVQGADSGDELGNLAQVLNSTFARLESAFERQRQFTADAAHELRTPLAVIIAETQTALARERNAEDYRETVEGCLETAQQMRRLTESLLELARFDGTLELAREDADVTDVVRLSAERIRPLATRRGIAIEGTFEPARAFINRDRIAQVIANLLTNAIDYNQPDGKVRIATQSASDGAVITVGDTGVGIPSADVGHIFERFYRVDKARSRTQGHTGLGLAISKAIIESEGGSIEATSVLGEGTTFTVRLPGAQDVKR